MAANASEACRRYRLKHPDRVRLQLLVNNAKIRATKHGVPFSLTVADISIPECCPVFGVTFSRPTGRARGPGDYSPSLDRIDPALGYVAGNIRVISYRANRISNDATVGELEAVLAYAKGL